MTTSKDKKQQVTILGHKSKILLINILRQGYITAEQKQAFSSLLECKTFRMIYVSKREDLEELEKMYQEILGEKERKEAFEKRGYIESDNMNIKDNFNTE